MSIHKGVVKTSSGSGHAVENPHYSIRACFIMEKIGLGTDGGMTRYDLAKALDGAGIDHNDFRRDNMIMVMEPRYYVIDFGESNLRAPNIRETKQTIPTLRI